MKPMNECDDINTPNTQPPKNMTPMGKGCYFRFDDGNKINFKYIWVSWANTTPNTTNKLTHWGRVTHICVGKLTIIGSDNGLSPDGRCQSIIWANAGILLIGHLATIISEISIGIQTLSFKKLHLKILYAKWRPFCLGISVSMKVRNGTNYTSGALNKICPTSSYSRWRYQMKHFPR